MSICEKDLSLLRPSDSNPGSVRRGWSSELLSLVRLRLSSSPFIPTGIDRQGLTDANRNRILSILGASPDQWDDWRWQATHKVENVDVLKEVLNLDDAQTSFLDSTGRERPWSVTPYYLSLMSPDPSCPIRLQAIPVPSSENGAGQEVSTPRTSRLLPRRQSVIRVTSQCAMRCQYCQFCRTHRGQPEDGARLQAHLTRTVDYVKEHTENREVVVTGGDPLMLDDATLEWLLSELTSLPHVESVTLETRALATLPQRVTPELADMVASRSCVGVTTHINSPLEVSRECLEACTRLRAAGVTLENRPMRLRGVNDRKYIMKRLNDVLRQVGFTPAKKRKAV